MGQSEAMAWPHHCLTAPLYLCMCACKCQLFTEEGSRRLLNPLIRMWMQPNLLEPVTRGVPCEKVQQTRGFCNVRKHAPNSEESEGWVPFVISKLNSVHLLGDILENCVGSILQYHMWELHWLWGVLGFRAACLVNMVLPPVWSYR